MDDSPNLFNKDEYWPNMVTIASLLDENDVENLKYLNSDIADLDNVTSLQLIKILEHHGVVGFNNISKFKEQLCLIGRIDLVEYLDDKFSNALLKDTGISRIPNGFIFEFNLPNGEKCAQVEYKLNQQDWININMEKKAYQSYVVSRRKNTKLFVKIENFMLVNAKIYFKFTFQGSNENIFQVVCTVVIAGMRDYELNYNQLIISLPEAIDFNENIRKLDLIDWQLALGINQSEFLNEIGIAAAVNYINKYFPNNDVILTHNQFGEKDNLTIVFHRFFEILREIEYTRAILISYPINYYSCNFLQSFFENMKHLRFSGDENKLSIFISKYSLVIFVRIASSLEQIRAECANCLNDIILFYNVNKSLIENEELNILGTVVLPIKRSELKEEMFFHFSNELNLDRVLFLCQDDLNNVEKFENWWRLTIAYFYYKRNKFPVSNEFLFKKLIGLAMFFMEKLDTNNISLLSTLVSESSPQIQIEPLALNNQQMNAINNNMRIKIITGGNGSGKSIVGKKIVESFKSKMSKNYLAFYYICCNHFSLFECEMKEFVDKIEKPPDVTVVCDNLYELWKKMCEDKKISETNISLPKLLEYLASTQNNKVYFVLEELFDECFNEEDVKHLKKLFSSELKESKVVMIIKPSNETNYLNTLLSQKMIGMETISLNDEIRGTNYLKLFKESAQEYLIKYKTFFYVPNKSRIQSAKFLWFVLALFCFNIIRKTVVICNNVEEVKSVAYVIDLMENFKAVHYSPYLQKYLPLCKNCSECQNCCCCSQYKNCCCCSQCENCCCKESCCCLAKKKNSIYKNHNFGLTIPKKELKTSENMSTSNIKCLKKTSDFNFTFKQSNLMRKYKNQSEYAFECSKKKRKVQHLINSVIDCFLKDQKKSFEIQNQSDFNFTFKQSSLIREYKNQSDFNFTFKQSSLIREYKNQSDFNFSFDGLRKYKNLSDCLYKDREKLKVQNQSVVLDCFFERKVVELLNQLVALDCFFERKAVELLNQLDLVLVLDCLFELLRELMELLNQSDLALDTTFCRDPYMEIQFCSDWLFKRSRNTMEILNQSDWLFEHSKKIMEIRNQSALFSTTEKINASVMDYGTKKFAYEIEKKSFKKGIGFITFCKILGKCIPYSIQVI
nr:uncharacterized protein LOC105848783 isoform X3 [Hydra vulgaris]